MATATITMIYCVHEATGIDLGAIEAIATLPAKVVPEEFGGSLLQAIKALPGVLAALDAAQAAPDDLYVTTSTKGDIDLAIWPGSGETVPMRADQSQAPFIAIDFQGSQNISLWDHDVSGDDHLGSVTILEREQGEGEIAQLAKSTVEQSYYYVFYRVE
jgi:hypothetical protein